MDRQDNPMQGSHRSQTWHFLRAQVKADSCAVHPARKKETAKSGNSIGCPASGCPAGTRKVCRDHACNSPTGSAWFTQTGTAGAAARLALFPVLAHVQSPFFQVSEAFSGFTKLRRVETTVGSASLLKIERCRKCLISKDFCQWLKYVWTVAYPYGPTGETRQQGQVSSLHRSTHVFLITHARRRGQYLVNALFTGP